MRKQNLKQDPNYLQSLQHMKSCIVRFVTSKNYREGLKLVPPFSKEYEGVQEPLVMKLLDQTEDVNTDIKIGGLKTGDQNEDMTSSYDTLFTYELLDEGILQQVEQFKFLDFFKARLRKRSTLFKGEKSIEVVLTAKMTPLKGGSLLLLNKTEDKAASKIFEHVLDIMVPARLSLASLASRLPHSPVTRLARQSLTSHSPRLPVTRLTPRRTGTWAGRQRHLLTRALAGGGWVSFSRRSRTAAHR